MGVRVLLVRGGGDPRHAAALCFWAAHEARVSLLGRGRWDPGAGPFCVFPVLSCHLGSARDQGADPLTEPRMAAPAPWEDTGEARSIPPPIPPPPPLILPVTRLSCDRDCSLHRGAPSGVAASRAEPSVGGWGRGPQGAQAAPPFLSGSPEAFAAPRVWSPAWPREGWREAGVDLRWTTLSTRVLQATHCKPRRFHSDLYGYLLRQFSGRCFAVSWKGAAFVYK